MENTKIKINIEDIRVNSNLEISVEKKDNHKSEEELCKLYRKQILKTIISDMTLDIRFCDRIENWNFSEIFDGV